MRVKSDIPTVEILGVPIHAVSMKRAIAEIVALAHGGVPSFVVTMNTEMIMRAQGEPAFMEVMKSAALSIPDTMGIVWASKFFGHQLQERVAGSDLIIQLAEAGAKENLRIFLLGASPGVAEKVASQFRELYPGIVIVGTHGGSPAVAEDDDICNRIRSAQPQVLMVAYPVPDQEYWIARNIHRLGVPVIINFGGSFDFIAGIKKRAPRWMREIGLEWLYRLLQQPSRWHRMLALPHFVLKVITRRLVGRSFHALVSIQ